MGIRISVRIQVFWYQGICFTSVFFFCQIRLGSYRVGLVQMDCRIPEKKNTKDPKKYLILSIIGFSYFRIRFSSLVFWILVQFSGNIWPRPKYLRVFYSKLNHFWGRYRFGQGRSQIFGVQFKIEYINPKNFRKKKKQKKNGCPSQVRPLGMDLMILVLCPCLQQPIWNCPPTYLTTKRNK